MKLLQVAKFFNPDTGGIETVTEQISEMLVDHGISADVLCTTLNGDYNEIHRNYKVIRCASNVGVGNKRFSVQYLRYIKDMSHDYDCALVHMPNPFAALAMLLFWKKPIVLLWHADTPQKWVRLLAGWVDRKIASRSVRVIGPTPIHLKESYIADYLLPAGVVIPYPFNAKRLPQATGVSKIALDVRKWARGRKLAIAIGRVVPYKGFDVLIDAAARFDEKLAAIIVGGGALLDKHRETIRSSGVADRIMCVGAVSDQELADLLSMASIGCMPSVSAAEMYGVAQVEAMSFHMPVVSTRLARSGVSYVNRNYETGLVVEPRDANELAAAMNILVSDAALYDRLSKGAYRSFEQDHALAPVSQRYADLIRDVVSGKLKSQ